MLVLLAVSLSLNVHLGWRVRQLENAFGSPGNSIFLSIGMTVPPVMATDLKGKQETISYAGYSMPTVLYIFSPTCVWCDLNTENIKTLVAFSRNTFRFIGLSLTEAELQEYLNIHQLNFPVYELLPDTIGRLGLGVTPQTIVVSPEGKVLRNWIGAYGGRTQREVEAYFGIALPGLPSKELNEGASSFSSCGYCIRDGLVYSVGAVIKIGNHRWRCNEGGQWAKL
ncbi:MAG: hypothetical protein RMM98_09760 [Acidobacteriota bacterium]|nr:peroxiredoxin family protein [Blastocatellia bacterium]MDW8239889.1 hypothetical protein [Acidobacteriota bacterium]